MNNAKVKIKIKDADAIVKLTITEIPRKEEEYGRGHWLDVEFGNGYTEPFDYRYMEGYTFDGAVADIIVSRYQGRIESVNVSRGEA